MMGMSLFGFGKPKPEKTGNLEQRPQRTPSEPRYTEEQFWEDLGRPQQELIRRYQESPLLTTMLQYLMVDETTLPEMFEIHGEDVLAITDNVYRRFLFSFHRIPPLEELSFEYYYFSSSGDHSISGNLISKEQLDTYLKCRKGKSYHDPIQKEELVRMAHTAQNAPLAMAKAINTRLGGQYELLDSDYYYYAALRLKPLRSF